MSLVVWLPLTKDTRNQGLSDCTVEEITNPVFDSNGKLGKALSEGRIRIPASKVGDIFNNNTMTVAFWYNNNTSSTSGNHAICGFSGNVDGDTDAVRIWDFFNYSVPTQFHWSMGTLGSGSLANAFPANTWVHVCVTWSAPTLKIYLDGVLKYTGSGSSNYTFNKSYYISFGHTPQKLNDFRIYDHCLSPMEVKQISQGLILHYPLSRNGMGPDNLIPNSLTYSGWSINSLWTQSTSNGEIIWSASRTGATGYQWNRIIPPTQFNPNNYPNGITVSFDFKCDDISALDHKCICALQIYKSDGTRIGWYESKNSFIETNYVGSSTLQNGQWKRLSCYFTQGAMQVISTGSYTVADVSYTTVSFQLVKNGSISIKKIKIEEGNHVSPYSISSQDDSAIEYDTSGFGNNGTRTGTFTWTSNAPKYAVSQVFNGTDNAIQTPSLPTMITDKNYTIAVWIYKTVIGSKGYQTIYGGPSGFEIEARNGGANETKFVPWNWGKPMASYELNEWNHCVFVHSDADCKIYLNGEYIATGTAKASNPTGNYFIGAWNTATQQNFDGLMSDFRIYATALSASDVLSLYQNSAYIDSQGNTFASSYVEG